MFLTPSFKRNFKQKITKMFIKKLKTNSNFYTIARNGGRIMQTLSADKRSKIIKDYAHSLLQNASLIAEANKVDLDLAKKNSKLKFFARIKKPKLLI